MKLALALVLTFSQLAVLSCGSNIGEGIDAGDTSLPDTDNDGYDTSVDCNDRDSTVHPGAIDFCEDNVDNDCDGTVDGPNCAGPCEIAAMERSSVGCVYYPVDTNGFQPGQYAIAISNVNATKTASVVVETKMGAIWMPIADGNHTVGPEALQTIPLPHRAVDGSALYEGGAYRVTSDLPVIAYQFSPLDGAASFYSDASLLLPAAAHDTQYIVPAWPYGNADGGDRYPAHVQITAGAATQVTVTSPIATLAGAGVPALEPNVPQTISMQDGDYLQLTAAVPDTSFNGTRVSASAPVGVFTSNDCVNVPLANCCCEHLEEQVFGLQTWGKTYAASRVPVRSNEPAVWQIMAQQDGTVVNFTFPAGVTGLPATVTLGARQMVEYTVNGPVGAPGDFLINSDKPVLVTQFMVASALAGGNEGDPSMVQAVPVEQYLRSYVVLIPSTWEKDFLVLTRTTGTQVTVNDSPVNAGWVDIGGGYEANRLATADGVHKIVGVEPVGVIVVGYDQFDSYAYPGGLDQQVINPIE
jgi:hypothetical protein